MSSLSKATVRWRFTTHEGYGVPGVPDAAVTINGQPVSDLPPLINALAFHSAWPQTDQAIPLPQPEVLGSVTPVGAPITTNDGLTYVLANAESPSNGVVAVLMAFRTNQEVELTVGPMDPGQVPPTPGDEVKEPNDLELYLLHRIEALRDFTEVRTTVTVRPLPFTS